MPKSQQALGHFDIPVDIADLLLGFCLLKPGDRILDPGCGKGDLLYRAGEWLEWLAANKTDFVEDPLWGVELDEDAAGEALRKIARYPYYKQEFFCP